MSNTVLDPVFGEMEYDHSWCKTEEKTVFGKNLEIRIVVEAYAGQEILEVQQKAYSLYKQEYLNYIKEIPSVLLKYYLDNYELISENINIPEKINKNNINKELIAKLIRLKTVYFDRKGQFGWLCDCAWDPEHGICILLSDDVIRVEEQDYLL